MPPRPVSLRAISTVDALIALQGVEDPRERKKRAVAKGRNALDVLDTLKLAVLDGSVDRSTLARLKVAAEGPDRGDRRSRPRQRCWARSTCAWRSNWPRPASASAGSRLPVQNWSPGGLEAGRLFRQIQPSH